ncbi:MAG TPA: NUDIX hydrolase [Actinomycetota bacterium]|nr:NUDIX hydrolase [Actinomycetota bacterium]
MTETPTLAARIDAVARGDRAGWTPPPVRSAATVALVRAGTDGVQVYLMKRVRTMVFAPTMHVFPGGAVEPDDGPPESAEGFRAAAVREVEEETGLLLPDPSALVPFARWVTPEVEVRRYDTAFFAVEVPPGVGPELTGTEASHSEWLTPEVALSENAAGRMAMLPPTIATLHQLSGYPDPATLLAGVALLPRPVLMPVPVLVNDQLTWTLHDLAAGTVLTDSTQAGLPASWSMGLG